MGWTNTAAFFMAFVIPTLFLVPAQVDGSLGISWWGTFSVLFAGLGVLLCLASFALGNDYCGESPSEKHVTRTESAIIFGADILAILFLVLLCMKLQTDTVPWWMVFVPAWPFWLLIILGFSLRLVRIQQKLAGTDVTEALVVIEGQQFTEERTADVPVFSGKRRQSLQRRRFYFIGAIVLVVMIIVFSILLVVFLGSPGFTSLLGLFLPLLIPLTLLTILMFVVIALWRYGQFSDYPWWKLAANATLLLGIDVFMLLALLKLGYNWGVSWMVLGVPLYIGFIFSYIVMLFVVFRNKDLRIGRNGGEFQDPFDLL